MKMEQTMTMLVTWACDLIQYRLSGAPWKAWEQQPDPPEGYDAAGPWVCLEMRRGALDVEDDDAWVWARALNIDRAYIQRQEAEAERAKRHATTKTAIKRFARDLADAVLDGSFLIPDDLAKAVHEAKEQPSWRLVCAVLMKLKMDDLYGIAGAAGLYDEARQHRTKDAVISIIVDAYETKAALS